MFWLIPSWNTLTRTTSLDSNCNQNVFSVLGKVLKTVLSFIWKHLLFLCSFKSSSTQTQPQLGLYKASCPYSRTPFWNFKFPPSLVLIPPYIQSEIDISKETRLSVLLFSLSYYHLKYQHPPHTPPAENMGNRLTLSGFPFESFNPNPEFKSKILQNSCFPTRIPVTKHSPFLYVL